MELYEPNLFATRDQELLLKASLQEGDIAIGAWEAWKRNNDFEGHHDGGSFRLFPLLYANLKNLNYEDPLMNRLKGIYRLSWYENHKLFHDISQVLSYLTENGIKTMLLKGAALTILHYKNFAIRPMSDIDILVPVSQAMETINLLTRKGWKPTTRSIEDDLRYRHSIQFKDESGREFDLHWHLLLETCIEDSDKDFWNDALPLSMCGVASMALNPTDSLFHLIIHGVRWNPEPPIRWIADAVTIINTSRKEIDWSRLIRNAKEHRVGLRLRKALVYLNDKFQTGIPVSVMIDIRKIPVSPVEKLEYRYIMSSQENNILGDFPYIFRFLRSSRGLGPLHSAAEYPKFLKYALNVRSYRQLLLKITYGGIKRMNRMIFSKNRIPDN